MKKKSKCSRSKSAPKSIVSLEKEAKAVELRKSGCTLKTIAGQMKISIAGASLVLARAMGRLEKQSKERSSEFRRLQLERLDDLLFSCWEQAKSGDLNAIGVVLKIEERRARLLGLDFPDQQPLGVESEKVEKVINRLQTREIDVTQAALEASKMGAILPEALRIMLSKTPPIMVSNNFDITSTDELDQKALEVLAHVKWQHECFIPERQQEVIELKKELKGAESFAQGPGKEEGS